MVCDRRASAGGGPRGKLTGDPAIELAGVAVRFGLDPLTVLGSAPGDLQVYTVALAAAARQRAEETKSYLDYLAGKTAVDTTTGFASVMRAAVKALRPRQRER